MKTLKVFVIKSENFSISHETTLMIKKYVNFCLPIICCDVLSSHCEILIHIFYSNYLSLPPQMWGNFK